MIKANVDKILNKINYQDISQSDIDKAFKKVENNKEAVEELAVRLIKEKVGYVSGRGDLFKMFPDYVKNDAKMLEKCFQSLEGYTLNPCSNWFDSTKHQFVCPYYDNKPAGIAVVDGIFYDQTTFLPAEMARVAANPEYFFKSYTLISFKKEGSTIFKQDLDILKQIAIRSLEVECESYKSEAEKTEFMKYAEEVKQKIDKELELAAQIDKSNDPIENA